jgi:hypothetical protein
MMNEFENIHKSISALPEYKDIYEEVVKHNFDNISPAPFLCYYL